MLLSWRVGSQRCRSSERPVQEREVAGEEPPATFNTADGTWNQRAGVEERVRETMELSIPNEAIRREALHFLALAIENADEERGNAWYVRETEHGLRLMTGRLLACEVARSKMRVSVIGPIGDDVRGALGAEAEKDEEFKKVPGGLLLTFPVEHAAKALDLLRDGLNSFVDMAMARVRTLGQPRRSRPRSGCLHRQRRRPRVAAARARRRVAGFRAAR